MTEQNRSENLVICGQNIHIRRHDFYVAHAEGKNAEPARKVEPEFPSSVGGGCPINTRSGSFDLQSAEFREVAAADKLFDPEGIEIAVNVGGQLWN